MISLFVAIDPIVEGNPLVLREDYRDIPARGYTVSFVKHSFAQAFLHLLQSPQASNAAPLK